MAALGFKKLENENDFATYLLEMGYFKNLELAEKATKGLAIPPSGEIEEETIK